MTKTTKTVPLVSLRFSLEGVINFFEKENPVILKKRDMHANYYLNPMQPILTSYSVLAADAQKREKFYLAQKLREIPSNIGGECFSFSMITEEPPKQEDVLQMQYRIIFEEYKQRVRILKELVELGLADIVVDLGKMKITGANAIGEANRQIAIANIFFGRDKQLKERYLLHSFRDVTDKGPYLI